MICENIDLYDYFKIERNGAVGGYLKTYARDKSPEMPSRVRPAMLVLPGGGYRIVSAREGEPVALRYVNEGFSSFVLTYSVNTPYPVPLNEAVMASAYIRKNAEKYGVDPRRVCVAGFSAGGHLAGLLATVKDEEAGFLSKTAAEVRPDAAVLSYAVVTMDLATHSGSRDVITGGNKKLYEKLSVEKRVDKYSAPAFIWHAVCDDCVLVENAVMLAQAYRKAGVHFSLHVFDWGCHGISLSNDEVCTYPKGEVYLYELGKWVDLSLSWLRSHGLALTQINLQ